MGKTSLQDFAGSRRRSRKKKNEALLFPIHFCDFFLTNFNVHKKSLNHMRKKKIRTKLMSFKIMEIMWKHKVEGQYQYSPKFVRRVWALHRCKQAKNSNLL
uniref:(northern house mosquito) hypothetical protein n=1 Tax=Culex pipiens TaxID=7175 RepID=A0A8D8BQS1_CULPI